MKSRKHLSLPCGILAAVTFCTVLLWPPHGPKATAALEGNTATGPTARHQHNDLPGTVRGMDNPNAIPDRMAYALLFRFIANHRGDLNKEHEIKAYIRGLGLGRQCQHCPSVNEQGQTVIRQSVGKDDDDIDGLLAVVDEFQRKVGALDAQAMEIKDRTWPNPNSEVMEQLTALQRKKEAILDGLIASLPRRLSAGGVKRVLDHVGGRVKQMSKRVPGPASLPGGPGWKAVPGHH